MGRLFGTSGLRGVVGKDITPHLAIELGLTVAAHVGNSGVVVVGKDPRTSSSMLEGCLISGLLSGGCDVKRLGMTLTPALSFAARALKAKAGVMITASHNPPEYNGFKICESSGMFYVPKLEAEIERIYFGKLWKQKRWNEIGKIEEVDILEDYTVSLAGAVDVSRGHSVVVDCGNGAGSLVTPLFLERLGCKVTSMNSEPDGLFPGRPPEPSPENLRELCKVVRSTGSDIGFAHDGDADRVVVVDEKGRVAQEDKILALIAAHQVKKKGDRVVTTVDASNVVEEVVGERGGKVLRTKVGDVSVAAEVKRSGAVFGGEPSGAWIFPNFQSAPDGPLGAAKVLELLSLTGKKLSELLESLPEFYTAREKVACPNEHKVWLMRSAQKKLEREFGKVIGVLKVDGLRLNFEDGWILVRPSGTEPFIRVTAEAKSRARADWIAKRALKILSDILKGQI
jgi:phosphoglucosamine mutase